MNSKSLSILVACALLLLAACRKGPIDQQNGASTAKGLSYYNYDLDTDPYFVDEDLALSFAEQIHDTTFFHLANGSGLRAFDDYYTLLDDDGRPALYVFNYAGGGYLVLSADFRYMPICAYAERGAFLKTDTVPSMLASWIDATIGKIEHLRGTDDMGGDPGQEGIVGWAALSGAIRLQDLPNLNVVRQAVGGLPCYSSTPPVITLRAPLLRTRWGQDCYYNDKLPFAQCSGTCNGRYSTGCAATAMAQLIRYWAPAHLPYNFAVMPDSATAFTDNGDMAFLMRDCGQAAQTHYTCNGAAVNGDHIVPALSGTFGFSEPGIYADFQFATDRWKVQQQIDQGRPLFFGGYDKIKRILFIPYKKSGHVWLCDGYREEKDYCRNSLWFHMNWGWDGERNAWYYQSLWEPVPGYNYRYEQSYIYNVHP